MARRISQPILDGGVRQPNFFNGRPLTADDLKDLQAASDRRHEQLARAIGHGVVVGLQVEPVRGDEGRVDVKKGLAVSRAGEILSLEEDTEVALTKGDGDGERASAGAFSACEASVASDVPAGTGACILVASPASGFEARAAKVGVRDEGVARGCGDRYRVEGIRFRLVPVDLGNADLVGEEIRELAGANVSDQLDKVSKLRNLLAHRCFRTKMLAAFPEAPFSALQPGGLLDALLGNEALTEADVPLALLYRANETMQFIGMWSVRRRPVRPRVDEEWPFHTGQRRIAEAEATFLQFQEQLDWLGANPLDLSQAQAADYFRYLPAAGYLPIPGEAARSFFSGFPIDRFATDRATLRALIHRSWFLDPIDLADAEERSGQLPPVVRLHEGRETDAARGYVLFERGARTEVPAPGRRPRRAEPDPRRGRIEVTVEATGDLATQAEAVFRSPIKKDARFSLWAEDMETGRWYEAEVSDAAWETPEFRTSASSVSPVGGPSATFSRRSFGRSPFAVTRPRRFQYVIRSLPAGTYKVHLRAKGFREASRWREVSAGETEGITFHLTPLPGRAPPAVRRAESPELDADASWIEVPTGGSGEAAKPFASMHVREPWFRWPWDSSSLPNTFQEVATDAAPNGVRNRLLEWAEWIRARYSIPAVDPGDIRIYLDRSWSWPTLLEVGTQDSVGDEWSEVRLKSTFASPPVVLTSIQTFNSPGAVGTRLRNRSESGFEVRVEEARNGSIEKEKIGYLVATPGEIRNAAAAPIGEAGIVEREQPDGSTWHTIDLKNSYTKPVVAMQIMSFNGSQPAHTRVRNVGSTSFEFQIEEWEYQNKSHVREAIGYVVLEEGVHSLADGSTVDVGTIRTNHAGAPVESVTSGQPRPVIISHCQSTNDSASVVTRQQWNQSGKLQIRLQEQDREANHAMETVGYIAAYRPDPQPQATSNLRTIASRDERSGQIEMPQNPYAYLVFGEPGGAYTPLCLTVPGMALSLEEDPYRLFEDWPATVIRRLEKVGIDRLDVLAASWTGLVRRGVEGFPSVFDRNRLAMLAVSSARRSVTLRKEETETGGGNEGSG